ncbi:MAG: hypothetical protein R3F11_10110 [Verrucomicrobiales bacterium]
MVKPQRSIPMVDQRLSSAAEYLSPCQDDFWRWDWKMEALEWTGGGTIAFYDEVHAALDRVSAFRLPPFQTVVILLAATQMNWLESSRLDILIGYAGSLDQRQLAEALPPGWQQRLMATLDRVHHLAGSGKRSLAKKVTIIEQFFQAEIPTPAGAIAARDLLAEIKLGLPPELVSGNTRQVGQREKTAAFAGAVRQIIATKLSGDGRRIELLTETGFAEVPAAAADLAEDAEFPDADKIRRLVADLARSGAEFSGIARAAQDLMAAVHLPKAVADPEDMPLGGVSDISNRGQLDRLLLTELANDDETLSIRVALNEALYLRREAPPKTPSRRRVLLVDCGIRLWGLPRAFAASVALALGATADRRDRVDACRPERGRLVPSDLATRDGLVAHLAALDTAPHPGGVLAEFADRWADERDAADLVVITHANCLADPEFQRAVEGAVAGGPLFVAAVDGEGRYALHSYAAAGRRLLQEAAIDLAQIAEGAARDRRTAGGLKIAAADPNLPAILSMPQFPLRVPYQLDADRSRYAPGTGVLSYARDGRVFLWDKARRGARLISSELPLGGVFWMHLCAETEHAHFVVVAPGGTITLFSVHLSSGASRRVDLGSCNSGARPHFVHHGGNLFICGERAITMHSLADGKVGVKLNSELFAGMAWTLFPWRRGIWLALAGDAGPRLWNWMATLRSSAIITGRDLRDPISTCPDCPCL